MAGLTFAEARSYVESLQILGMRFGLERMRRLLAALGRPERRQPAIHVVGTNGKSSTTRMIAAILEGQGRRAGAYLSPHVTGWPERIELRGRPLSEERFAGAIFAVRAAAEGLELAAHDGVTQFEVLTAAAFLALSEAGVDVAVIEAGLGGRYDATNVLAADALVVLTNVALEHTELLGDTEEAIAREKLAVAVEGADRVVVGPMAAEAAAAVEVVLAERRLQPWCHGGDFRTAGEGDDLEVTTPGARYGGLSLPLAGRFQRDNLAVAVAAAERFLGRPLSVEPLRRAVASLRMPGRLEVVADEPLVVLDGAHNPAGMHALAESLPAVIGTRETVAVVSVLDDKDAAGMVTPLAAVCHRLIATRSSHARSTAPHALARLAREAGMDAEAVESPRDAVATARRRAGPEGAVVVCGSLYLLADLRLEIIEEARNVPATLAPGSGARGRTR